MGDDCVVGHVAHLEGCRIENGALIGSGSIVLHGAVVGTGSIVGANAVITNGMEVPPNSMALGIPAKIRPAPEHQDTMILFNGQLRRAGQRYRKELRRIDWRGARRHGHDDTYDEAKSPGARRCPRGGRGGRRHPGLHHRGLRTWRAASAIWLVAGVDEALELLGRHPGCARDGRSTARRPPGFHLSNSPVHVSEADVDGRVIVQRTSAGTQGVVAASGGGAALRGQPRVRISDRGRGRCDGPRDPDLRDHRPLPGQAGRR